MKRREQITRGRLRAQIHVQVLEAGKVCIFCPTEVAEDLYQYLYAKRFSFSCPARAVFGRYPTDELIGTMSLDQASTEVTEFVDSLPEVCYERDVL